MVAGSDKGNVMIQGPNNAKSLSLVGGTSGDYFGVATRGQFSSDYIAGDLGVDSLALNGGGTYGDGDFTKVSGIEWLSLGGATTYTISLGSTLQSVGVTTLYGGSGNDVINQTTADTLSIFIDAGRGSDSIILPDLNFLINDTINGGSGGYASDTLSITSLTSNVDDSSFIYVSNIEHLNLGGTSNINLGLYVQAAGIKQINAVTLPGSTLAAIGMNASSYTTSGITLNGAANTSGVSLLGGNLADSIVGGSGVDTIQGWSPNYQMASDLQISGVFEQTADTLTGGGGADRFILGTEAGNAYTAAANGAGQLVGAADYAYITDFVVSSTSSLSDVLQLHKFTGGTFSGGASDYTVLAVTGDALYNTQIFQKSDNNLIANLQVTGTQANILNNAIFV